MRPVITFIAIVSFSLHLLLGCCWHHAHGDDCPPGHSHGLQAYDHSHAHGHHDHATHQHATHEHGSGDSTPAGEDSEPPTSSCCDLQCSYVSVEAAAAPHCDLVTLLPIKLVEPTSFASNCVVYVTLEEGDTFEPPVRLHLAHAQLLN